MRLSVVLIVALASSSAFASPNTMLHQGRLLDASGLAVEGNTQLGLALYTQAAGGSATCNETDTVDVAQGYYSTVLGDNGCNLQTIAFGATTYWLEVSVGGNPLDPRTELHGVPVSLNAGGAGGLLPPSLTTAQRNALSGPQPGQLIFNSTNNELQMYNGNAWVRVGSSVADIQEDEVMYVWGRNTQGELGTGDTTEVRYPTLVDLGSEVLDISAGGYVHGSEGASCLVTTDNRLLCTGDYRHIPDGTTTDRRVFTAGGLGLTWTEVNVGKGLVSCGVTEPSGPSDVNNAYCWGYRQYGGLGNGENTGSYATSPQQVIGDLQWKHFAPGGRYNGDRHEAFVCGVTTEASDNGYCWGRDYYMTLGNGGGNGENVYTFTDPTDVRVNGGHTWERIWPGYYNVCGIDTAGAAWCWGEASQGRLGTGNQTDRDVPTAVTGGHRFTQLALGELHGCGITTDGAMYCWGDNNYGQLGDGTTTDRWDPVPVVGNKRWIDVTAGQYFTCGIDTSNRAWCWGYNGNYQLGNGSNSNERAPIPVYGDYRFRDLAAGYRHVIGITD